MYNYQKVSLSYCRIASPLIFVSLIFLFMQSHGQETWTKDSLLFKENFDSGTLNNWVSELEIPEQSSVTIKDNKMDIEAGRGATIWFKPQLEGDILIEYDVTIVIEGGDNDRGSDLNQFWMAVDLKNPNLFTRNGSFGEYDDLQLYYVGMGGNTNSTTRFRRYPGNGDRPIIGEYTDAAHLLQDKTATYHIEIVCFQGRTQYVVDGEVFFDLKDPDAFTKGNYGIRTTRNHETFDNFKVYRLIDPNTKILPENHNIVFDNEYRGGMQIFNLSGKMVKETPPSFSWKEDIVKITGLSPGMYFFRPTTSKKLLARQIFLVD